MLGIRVIPCLLLGSSGLVKTQRFRSPMYLGDPVNTVKIFNTKEVDELVLLDILASKEGREPNYAVLSDIASECFAPLGYGGGLQTTDQMRRVLRLGYEKVVLNSAALRRPELIREAAEAFGRQSVSVSIDVKRDWWGRPKVFSHSRAGIPIADPVTWARQAQNLGAGEILLNAVDRDGCMKGYDIELIRLVSAAVTIPVIACGGAASVDDLAACIRQGGASAAAAGSMFVFQGRHRAVLISFPSPAVLESVFPERACHEPWVQRHFAERAA